MVAHIVTEIALAILDIIAIRYIIKEYVIKDPFEEGGGWDDEVIQTPTTTPRRVESNRF